VRRRADPETSAAVINIKRSLLLLPAYLAVVITIDAVFIHTRLTPGRPVPLWLVVAFITTAVVVAIVAIWYVVRWAGGKVPQQRHHVYMSLLVGIVISGFIADALKGIASLVLHGQPVWVLVPIYTIGYAVFCAVLAYTANRFDRHSRDTQGRSSSAV